MANKRDLNDYITTVKAIKPSAEVKFRSQDENGDVTESVASRTFVAKHANTEIDAVSNVPDLRERLNKVAEKAASAAVVTNDDLDEIENEVDEELLGEQVNVVFKDGQDTADNESSPMTHVPNAQHEAPTTANISETAMLIQLVSTLIDKVDAMQNFNPVIHVPAPVIHVTLPETKRTVTKAIERDENNWIKSVREHVEEAPVGEPLIEVIQQEAEVIAEAPVTKPRRRTKPKPKQKDSE